MRFVEICVVFGWSPLVLAGPAAFCVVLRWSRLVSLCFVWFGAGVGWSFCVVLGRSQLVSVRIVSTFCVFVGPVSAGLAAFCMDSSVVWCCFVLFVGLCWSHCARAGAS